MRMFPLRSLAVIGAACLFGFACGPTSGGGGTTAAKGCTKLSGLDATSQLVAARTPEADASSAPGMPVAADGTIKIGSVAPLTGDQQAIGVDEKNGVLLAADEVNKAGGLKVGDKTYTVDVVAKDDQHDPQLAVTVAQQLVDAGVVAVVGHLNSGATIPASKIYNDNKITMISPSATNPKVTDNGYKYVFRVVGRDDQQGPFAADYAIKTLGCKNIGIVDDKTAYGQGLADEFEKQVKVDGGTVVGHEHTTDKDTDFSAQLTSLKGKNPDLIYFGGIYPQGGPMAAQMKKLNITVPLMGGDGIHSGKFIELAGDGGNGSFATDAGPENSQLSGFGDFQTKYKAKFNQDVVQYAPEAYDAAKIIFAGITAGGSVTDRAKIRDSVAATKDFKGVVQTYTYDSKGDILKPYFTMYKVQGGKFVALKSLQFGA